MRCGICPVTFCQYRRTDGECVYEDSLEEKIKKATKTWEGVNVERYLAEVRGVNVDLIDAAQSLVDAVERCVQQKCLRSELLNKKNALKKLINGR